MLTKFGVNYLFLLEGVLICSLIIPEIDIKTKIAGFLLVVANECKLEILSILSASKSPDKNIEV